MAVVYIGNIAYIEKGILRTLSFFEGNSEQVLLLEHMRSANRLIGVLMYAADPIVVRKTLTRKRDR